MGTLNNFMELYELHEWNNSLIFFVFPRVFQLYELYDNTIGSRENAANVFSRALSYYRIIRIIYI